jgi:membrane fusion protein (multidrug efflux system)
MSADGSSNKVVEMKAAEGAPARPPAQPEAKPARRSRRRYFIMAAVPILLVIIGGYFWLTGGRYASTDNAYVQQDKVTLTSGVAGRIVEVKVGENDHVNAGDLLFRIDPEPYRIALAQADAALASARLQVEQLRAAYRQALSSVKVASDKNDFQTKNLQRQQDLLKKGVTTQAAFDQAQSDAQAAEQALAQATQAVESSKAALGGDPDIPTDKHPLVLAAQARRDQAALDLKDTDSVAPADGVVVQTGSLKVGQYVSSPAAMPTAVLGIVEDKTTSIVANFKETDLTHMKVGAKATVSIDAYPGRTFNAEVESIGAGTGSQFSLLPAQNATGNWVKVVQRVPVKLRLTDPSIDVALRTGLSASVSVDVRTGAGSAQAASKD